MPYTTADLLALGLEFDNDPAGIGYPSGGVENTSNDVPFWEAITLTRPTIAVLKTSLPSSAIAGVMRAEDHEALSDGQARWLKDCVLDVNTINPSTSPNIITGIAERLGNTPSGAAIAALFSRPGSRLEKMYQDGTISEVGNFTPSTPGQIRAARAAQ